MDGELEDWVVARRRPLNWKKLPVPVAEVDNASVSEDYASGSLLAAVVYATGGEVCLYNTTSTVARSCCLLPTWHRSDYARASVDWLYSRS